jgi:hypothetical protein
MKKFIFSLMLFAFVGTFVSCEKSNNNTPNATIYIGIMDEADCRMEIRHNVVYIYGLDSDVSDFSVPLITYQGDLIVEPCLDCLDGMDILSGSLKVENGKNVFRVKLKDDTFTFTYRVVEW